MTNEGEKKKETFTRLRIVLGGRFRFTQLRKSVANSGELQ